MSKLDYNDIIERGNKRMHPEDLKLLEQTARSIAAERIVEIGSMDGTSSLLLGSIARDNGGMLYCIEPKPKERWRVNIQDYKLQGSVRLIWGFSPWVDKAEPQAIPEVIDYLLIDGDHRTRWAIVDYHYWFPRVRVGGFIAFHDWNGRKGVAAWVRRAVEIILEDDGDKIKNVAVNKTPDRGICIFEKAAE